MLAPIGQRSCDLLKIRYLCGRNDNNELMKDNEKTVVICSKFAIFAVEMTTDSSAVTVTDEL